ncbi:MAG: hypothetical protein ACK5N8_05930 [Alphaproteobacteria bacterium]
MDIKILLEQSESDYLDFKSKWYAGKKGDFDLIHDIVSLSNSLSNSETRFILVGVSEKKTTKEKQIKNITKDKYRLSSEQIIAKLRSYVSNVPNIEVKAEQIKPRTYIDVIKITPAVYELPYVLTKDCTYTDDKKRLHTIFRDRVYSRIGERNTGVDESCPSIVLEKIFARKHGEHLPIIERFSMYLDDVANWKKLTIKNETTYYYTKNHTFKIIEVQLEDDNSHKYSRSVKTEMEDYSYALDYGICEEYWKYHLKTGCTYNDYCYWLDVQLWADNTPIDVFSLSSFHIKYYHIDKFGMNSGYSQDFYLPSVGSLSDIVYNTDKDNEMLKKAIVNTLQFKICRMLQVCKSSITNNHEYDYEKYLDFLNYEEMKAPSAYREKNKDFLYKKSNDKIKDKFL